MSTKSERSESARREGVDLGPFDQQQSHLLSILARRAGKPVSYDELRDAGIELPGSLVAELELAGVEVQRCFSTNPRGRRVRAVWLPAAANSTADLPETAAQAAKYSPRSLPISGKPQRPVRVSSKPRRREAADDASLASVPGWGPVRVYRGSLLRALAASLAHRRDAARFAAYRQPDRSSDGKPQPRRREV